MWNWISVRDSLLNLKNYSFSFANHLCRFFSASTASFRSSFVVRNAQLFHLFGSVCLDSTWDTWRLVGIAEIFNILISREIFETIVDLGAAFVEEIWLKFASYNDEFFSFNLWFSLCGFLLEKKVVKTTKYTCNKLWSSSSSRGDKQRFLNKNLIKVKHFEILRNLRSLEDSCKF